MTYKTTLLAGSVGVLSVFGLSLEAYAQNFSPDISGSVLFEVQNDWAFDSDDKDADVNTLTTTIEPYIVLSLTDKLALETQFTAEQVQDTDPNDDTIFENEGVYVEQLMLSYTADNYSIFGGKFGATFGTAWDLAPGIYGVDFAEDYELAEKIGFGASYSFSPEGTGNHIITGNSFFADTTFLSDSTITKRGDTDKSDGGVSNTEDFSSFSLSLDSENIFGVENLNTHIAYRNQSEGDADTGLDNESGYAIGANYSFPVSDDVEAVALAEWVGIRDAEGGNDDLDYLTASLGLVIYDNWNVASSYTARGRDVAGGADIDDYIYQLSSGYEFDNGITFDIGYSNIEESNINTDIIGALVSYTYEF